MRYSAAEKGEIIRLVENSSISVRRTLARLDIHKSTFYNWLKRYQDNGVDGLDDQKPSASMVWNKVPQEHNTAIIEMALEKPGLSPRELAVSYTDERAYLSQSLLFIGC